MACPAAADVFGRLSGTFGVPDVPEESCAINPVFSSFSPDHRRISFAWAKPVLSYSGAMITGFGGTVVQTGPDSITLLRDAETRLDAKGAQILWTMHETADGYCWTSSDQPAADCAALERCAPQPNS
jgi:hypothetical protein